MANINELVARNQQGKADFRAEKQAEREELSDMQNVGVCAITTDPAIYLAYLNLQADNPTISAGNLALVMEQQEDATMVASLEKWNKLGRSVRRGESGLKVLVPEKYRDEQGKIRTGFKVGRVFDVSQTSGGRLPTKVQLRDNTPEMEKALAALIGVCPASIEVVADFAEVSHYEPDSKTILITEGLTDSAQLAALTKEIAHANFHDGGFNTAYRREDYALDAESVSYMVCSRFGVECDAPDASGIAELYDQLEPKDRRTALDFDHSAADRMGRRVEEALNPPQQERQGGTYMEPEK